MNHVYGIIALVSLGLWLGYSLGFYYRLPRVRGDIDADPRGLAFLIVTMVSAIAYGVTR